MATHAPSEACCSVPAIVSEGYKAKGKYFTLDDGMKVYTTGPSTATSAIFIVYDIFGFFDQTIQGADILAHADKEHQYRVFVPDFFYGKPFDLSKFPAKNDEEKKAIGEFFGGPAAPPKNKEKVLELVKTLGSRPEGLGIQKWGSLGMCWGGKIVALTSGPGTPWSAGAEVHPGMIDANDAKEIKIPFAVLASGDEDKGQIKAFGDALTGQKHVETFQDQVHGWMAARADLKKDRVKEEYERGYKTLLNFYHQHL